jgi:3'-phosphoadenosine 5'-phosphosulfate sulfotransferase (PAPS reductase)/FAD synthetase
MDFSGKSVMIGLSGGINSMAVLCWMGTQVPKKNHPEKLYLFYADFKEHSDETIQFVLDGVFWARENIASEIIYEQTNNSVMEYFEGKEMIPHPKFSPCTHDLKIQLMLKYCFEHNIQMDLVGYVRHEMKRYKNLKKNRKDDLFFSKQFPIINNDDDWCFEIVKENIGYYPPIYNIKDNKGKRVFKHNNCLPCKNMTQKQLNDVKTYFPDKYERAMSIAESMGSYFGRDKDGGSCSICEF